MEDFYRIECVETGDGPYQSGEYNCVKNPSTDRHPTPWNEGLWDRSQVNDDDYRDDQAKFVCGFKSIEQLTDWFDVESLETMFMQGKRFGRHYSVIHFMSHSEHMRVAKRQAVARKSFLLEISRQELDAFIRKLKFKYEGAML